MRTITALFFLLFFGVSCSGGRQLPSVAVDHLSTPLEWLEGEWVGIGFQLGTDVRNTWAIELDVSLKKKAATVNYPSLECGGKWALSEGYAHSATFSEWITEGENRCFNGGIIKVTLIDENHISYSFFYPKDNSLGAYSTLVRKSHRRKQGGRIL